MLNVQEFEERNYGQFWNPSNYYGFAEREQDYNRHFQMQCGPIQDSKEMRPFLCDNSTQHYQEFGIEKEFGRHGNFQNCAYFEKTGMTFFEAEKKDQSTQTKSTGRDFPGANCLNLIQIMGRSAHSNQPRYFQGIGVLPSFMSNNSRSFMNHNW